MNAFQLTSFSFASMLAVAADLSAQVQVPVNPRATYLRHNVASDPALPAPAIPLSALSLTPGQWVQITVAGNFGPGGSTDNSRTMSCVFSSNGTLLTNTSTQLARVPGALTAGPDIATANTYFGNQPTDIPQDFIISRDSWANGTLVQVPAGATHLFLATLLNQNYTNWGNNTDPNNNLFAVFTPVTPATLQGTAEHCELLTGLNGPTTLTDVKQAAPFSNLTCDVVQRFNQSTNDIYVFGANVMATGGTPPIGPLPGFHMGLDYVIAQVGIVSTAPGQWSFFIPPGFAGTTIVVQGFYLSPAARNGLLQASNAHRIELQ